MFSKMKNKRAEARHRYLQARAKQLINVCEHDGAICLCFDGQPLVDIQQLSTDIITALREARERWVAYALELDK